MTVPDHESYTFAPVAGIYRPTHALGAAVRRGQPAGAIHSFDTPFAEPVTLHFARDGELWSTRGPGYVQAGDPVAVLVSPWG